VDLGKYKFFSNFSGFNIQGKQLITCLILSSEILERFLYFLTIMG